MPARSRPLRTWPRSTGTPRNTEDGQVNGFVVEQGTPGYQARVIAGRAITGLGAFT